MEKDKLISDKESYTPLNTNEDNPTNMDNDQDLKPDRKWWRKILTDLRGSFVVLPRRYMIAVLAFLGFCNLYSLRIILSVAIVDMTSGKPVPEFDWDSKTQGFILSTFFYGYIITQIPGGWLSSKFGGKNIFGGGILITSILTLCTPLALKIGGVPGLVIIRITQGLAEGVVYPASHAIWSKWSPIIERSRLATIAFSGSYMGTVISLPISGLLAHNYGWPSIFYTFGIVALIWTIVWLFTVGESPSEDKRTSEEEINYITSSLGPPSPTKKSPWGRIITSKPVWAINIAHFSENWGFYTLLTFLPRYIKDVYNMDLDQAGFVSALPYLCMAIVVQLAGFLADYLRTFYLTTTQVRKFFTCGAFIAQTFFMICAAYVGSPVWAIGCITLAVGLGGFAWAGFSVNHLDLAPHYASLLMGISNTFATIPGMISPYLAGRMVHNGSPLEWKEVFSVSASIYLIGAIVYGIIASGDQQQWARSSNCVELSDSSESD